MNSSERFLELVKETRTRMMERASRLKDGSEPGDRESAEIALVDLIVFSALEQNVRLNLQGGGEEKTDMPKPRKSPQRRRKKEAQPQAEGDSAQPE